MKFSLWNQNFVYSAAVPLKKSEAIEQLAALYRRKKHRKLDVFPQDGKLFVVKGSVLASIFSIGPETWFRHNIQVTAIEIAPSLRPLDSPRTSRARGRHRYAVLLDLRDHHGAVPDRPDHARGLPAALSPAAQHRGACPPHPRQPPAGNRLDRHAHPDPRAAGLAEHHRLGRLPLQRHAPCRAVQGDGDRRAVQVGVHLIPARTASSGNTSPTRT